MANQDYDDDIGDLIAGGIIAVGAIVGTFIVLKAIGSYINGEVITSKEAASINTQPTPYLPPQPTQSRTMHTLVDCYGRKHSYGDGLVEDCYGRKHSYGDGVMVDCYSRKHTYGDGQARDAYGRKCSYGDGVFIDPYSRKCTYDGDDEGGGAAGLVFVVCDDDDDD